MRVWSELRIGGNWIEQTRGVLAVEGGEDQAFLERGDRDAQLLLTMNFYDAQGDLVAKLRKNAWAYNDRDRFEITTAPASLTLHERETGNLVLEARVLGRDVLEVPRGDFYTRNGTRIVITPQAIQIVGVGKISGVSLVGARTAMVFHPDGSVTFGKG